MLLATCALSNAAPVDPTATQSSAPVVVAPAASAETVVVVPEISTPEVQDSESEIEKRRNALDYGPGVLCSVM